MFRHLALRDSRFPPLAAVLLAGIGFLPTLRYVWHELPIVRGWEADAIARAIVAGHGFSFPGNERWLWLAGDPETFFPTAWADPVFTYVLAGAHWLFGAHAYAAIYALTFLCVAAILFCIYRLASRFAGPWAGVLGVALAAAHTQLNLSYFSSISNVALGASALLVAVLASVRYFEDASSRRLIVMGLAMGFAVLACPASEYYLYALAAALVFFHWDRRDRSKAVSHTAALILLALAVVGPWTLRNYAVFSEFVLVRTGAGQITWAGTAGPAETFLADTADFPLAAPWQSQGPRDAVQKMLDSHLRLLMHNHEVATLAAAPPPGYEQMNEAQRDSIYMKRTIEFIKQHPGITAQMALYKLEIFVKRLGIYGIIVLLLAVPGALLLLRDRRSWPLILLALAYTAPFVLIIPYFARYRAPIEPVFAIFAAITVIRLLRWVLAFTGRNAIGRRVGASTS